MPGVSVVIPTYNRDKGLIRAVESALDQRYRPTEVIVVDDHSAVDVSECLARAGLAEEVELHRHDENRGANAARNTGAAAASGEYLAFLDDDDSWVPSKLGRQLEQLRQTNAAVAYSGSRQVESNTVVATKTPTLKGQVTRRLLTGNAIGTLSTILMERSAFERIDGFDPELPCWQDWDLYLRLSQREEFTGLEAPLVEKHRHDAGHISDDYLVKRDEGAPRFIQKHRMLAAEHEMEDTFRAAVNAGLGWSAVRNEHYADARSHYRRALVAKARPQYLMMLTLVSGGRWTYEPAKHAKRLIPGGAKFRG